MWTLGIPISKLFLYLPDATLSYLSKFNWSNVKSGFGNNCKNLADNRARNIGNGINNLFLSIIFNNLCKISFKEIISGPIHSIVVAVIFFEITW